MSTGPDKSLEGSQNRALIECLIAATIGVAMLFLALVYAPQRLKLPLLTPLALGALAGWGLGRLAYRQGLSRSRVVIVAAAILVAAGNVFAALETHRLGAPALRKTPPAPDLLAEGVERFLAEQGTSPNATTDSDVAQQQFREDLQKGQRLRDDAAARFERLQTFAGYLENRIPPAWGRWPWPWPAAFWVAEIAASATLAAWMAARFGRLARADDVR